MFWMLVVIMWLLARWRGGEVGDFSIMIGTPVKCSLLI